MLLVAAPFWGVLLGKGAQLLLEGSASVKMESATMPTRHAA
jgi:hypothetical protein